MSTRVIESPNIWRWPDIYEVENAAQDVDGSIFTALREVVGWAGADIVDVGCGAGFHLPEFAVDARTVIGVEPHPPLIERARARVDSSGSIRVVSGSAEALPFDDASVDVVHARTAYFFGPACAPGIGEAMRVLRPGGVLAIVDIDVSAHPYGEWMRRDLPRYRPGQVEKFFRAKGFELRRVDTRWMFRDRTDLAAVLGIEFSPRTAALAYEQTPGIALDVRYRIHTLQKARGLMTSWLRV